MSNKYWKPSIYHDDGQSTDYLLHQNGTETHPNTTASNLKDHV